MANSSDARLAQEVERALAHDPQVSIHDLRVDAVNSVVRLCGASHSLKTIRRARMLAAQVPGVSAVDSALAVELPRAASDADLERAAQSAVGTLDPRVQVQVADGVAILRGELDRSADLDRIVAAVEQIPGIKDLRPQVTFRAHLNGAPPFERR
jgi:osmotically-inducible protein OsmY